MRDHVQMVMSTDTFFTEGDGRYPEALEQFGPQADTPSSVTGEA